MFILRFQASQLRRTGVSALFVAVCVLGCGASDEGSATYHARGIVMESNGVGSELRVTIHHEAIDKFKDREGHESKMASMSMNFGVAESVPKASFKNGDKIAFDFDLRWSKTPPLLITSVKTLPADTALVLSDM